MNKIRVFLAWSDKLAKGVSYAGTALAGVNAITQNQNKSDNNLDNLAYNAVYGNPQADPIGRFFSDITGASVDTATDRIEDATESINDADVSVNGSTAQDIVRASANIGAGLPEKLKRIETVEGLGWKTLLSTALGAPWLDFDNSDSGVKLDTDNLQASAQGAQMGSSFGPWGTLFGGIAGGLFNLGSRLGRNDRAEKMNEYIDEYNAAIDNLVARRQASINNANLALQQNNFRNMFATRAAYGGPLSFTGDFDNGMTYFGTGGTHEQNKYGGIQQGVAPDGNPNLVEEGEWKWDDANYIFSKRIKIPKSIQEKYKLKEGMTFADAAGNLSKESEERPNDPISQNGLTAFMSDLAMAQEEIKAKRTKTKLNKAYTDVANSFPKGGFLSFLNWLTGKPKEEGEDNNQEEEDEPWQPTGNFASMAPIFGSGLQTLTDALGITNVSDYTHAYDILRGLNDLQDITYYNPGYSFMSYEPLSLQLLGNEQKALNLAALNRATQLAGSNRAARAAHALAAQYAGGKALSDALIGAYKANREQEQRVTEANNQILGNIDKGVNSTRQFNAELGSRRAAIRETAAKLMQTIDDAMDHNKSVNRDTFYTNLGTWGKEQQYKRLIDKNPWLLWDSSMNFKGR